MARIEIPASLRPNAGGPDRAAIRRLAAVAFVVAVFTSAGAAAAGDIYLRVGAGLEFSERTLFRDENCSSTTPAALYGCGTGNDGAPLRSAGDFGTAAAFEAGLGVAAPPLRFELLFEYRPRAVFSGRANFRQLSSPSRQSVDATASAASAMLAVYIDLPGLGVPKLDVPGLGTFELFVGTGLGLARLAIGQTRMTFPNTATIVPGGRRIDVAWMLTAGLATALTPRTTLELAWRYTDLGTIRTDRGPGRVIRLDGSSAPIPLDLAPTRARFRSHGVRLALRYAF